MLRVGLMLALTASGKVGREFCHSGLVRRSWPSSSQVIKDNHDGDAMQ
jgi:hypothetical protein